MLHGVGERCHFEEEIDSRDIVLSPSFSRESMEEFIPFVSVSSSSTLHSNRLPASLRS